MDDYLKGKRYVVGITCPHGHKVKKETEKTIDYPFICPTCEENYYSFEVKKV